MDQAIQILFSHAAVSPEQVKQAEAHLTAFERSEEFWEQAMQMLQNNRDIHVQSYLLMAMKRKVQSDCKHFSPSQKHALLDFVTTHVHVSPIRDQLLARMYALFWSSLNGEEERRQVIISTSLFYYFLEEDLDARITCWLTPIVKQEILPQLLGTAPNAECCGIIRMLVEKEIVSLDAAQVETLLGMAVQSGYPEELFDVLEILLEKCPPATFLPFIEYFLDDSEAPIEFVLFCTEWLEYASDVHLAPVYIKILRLACTHYEAADPCFSPQFLLEVSQLPLPLPMELEETVVLSASYLLRKISECVDMEEERKEGDLSMVRSALQPFAKLCYFEHFLGLGDALMTEAIAAHLPSISTFTLKNILTCCTLNAKEKMRIGNRLLRLLNETDLELLREFAIGAMKEHPVISLKLLRHLSKLVRVNFDEFYPGLDPRAFKVYVTCLEAYNPSVLEYILKLDDSSSLGSYICNVKQLPLDALVYGVLMDNKYEAVHSQIIERLEPNLQNQLFETLFQSGNDLLLLSKLGAKNRAFQSRILTTLLSALNSNSKSENEKSVIEQLCSFEGSDFVEPLLQTLNYDHLNDPELLQVTLKLLQHKPSYTPAFLTRCLALEVQDSFTDGLLACYLFRAYQSDPQTFLRLLKESPPRKLSIRPDTFRSERNFVSWWCTSSSNHSNN